MGGLRLGRIAGIPIEVRYSFLLLFVVAYYYGVAKGVGGLVSVVLLMMCGSVLLHELGHALVARRLGVPVILIDLHFFGGAARLAQLPERPRDEALIALAGPAVSLLVALASEGIYQLSGGAHVLNYLTAMNLLLGAFNLLPVLPLDGGRLLRALLVGRRGLDHERATAISVVVAKVAIVGFAAWALVSLEVLALIFAVFFWLAADGERRLARRWSQLGGGALGWDETTPTEVAVLDADGRAAGRRSTTLGSTYVIEEHSSPHGQRWVVRGEDGQVLLVTDTPLR